MTSTREIKSVAVVGAGLMGSGIAEAVALAGIDVVLRDVDQASIDRAQTRLDASLARAQKGGKLDAAAATAIRDRIELTTDLSVIAAADLVIEAVPEDEQLKLTVITAIGEIVARDAIIASNTSSIPITELAQAVPGPERVLGLHFFSPVPVMSLIEIVVALDTSAETLATARAFAQRLGKTPIESKDRAGFIVNMLLVPYLLAAMRMLEDGFATREDIDTGMKLGCGHPMGPLTLSDFIGLDVLYAIGVSLYDEFKRDEYAPPPLLARMVAALRWSRMRSASSPRPLVAPPSASSATSPRSPTRAQVSPTRSPGRARRSHTWTTPPSRSRRRSRSNDSPVSTAVRPSQPPATAWCGSLRNARSRRTRRRRRHRAYASSPRAPPRRT